jgi:hypothetical protein
VEEVVDGSASRVLGDPDDDVAGNRWCRPVVVILRPVVTAHRCADAADADPVFQASAL